MFKGPVAGTAWPMGGLERLPSQAGVQGARGPIGAGPCRGHGSCVEASGLS